MLVSPHPLAVQGDDLQAESFAGRVAEQQAGLLSERVGEELHLQFPRIVAGGIDNILHAAVHDAGKNLLVVLIDDVDDLVDADEVAGRAGIVDAAQGHEFAVFLDQGVFVAKADDLLAVAHGVHGVHGRAHQVFHPHDVQAAHLELVAVDPGPGVVDADVDIGRIEIGADDGQGDGVRAVEHPVGEVAVVVQAVALVLVGAAEVDATGKQGRVIDGHLPVAVEVVAGSRADVFGQDLHGVLPGVHDLLKAVLVEVAVQAGAAAIAVAVHPDIAVRRAGTVHIRLAIGVDRHLQLAGAAVQDDAGLRPVVEGVFFQAPQLVGGIVPINTGDESVAAVRDIGHVDPLAVQAGAVDVVAACGNAHVAAAVFRAAGTAAQVEHTEAVLEAHGDLGAVLLEYQVFGVAVVMEVVVAVVPGKLAVVVGRLSDVIIQLPDIFNPGSKADDVAQAIALQAAFLDEAGVGGIDGGKLQGVGQDVLPEHQVRAVRAVRVGLWQAGAVVDAGQRVVIAGSGVGAARYRPFVGKLPQYAVRAGIFIVANAYVVGSAGTEIGRNHRLRGAVAFVVIKEDSPGIVFRNIDALAGVINPDFGVAIAQAAGRDAVSAHAIRREGVPGIIKGGQVHAGIDRDGHIAGLARPAVELHDVGIPEIPGGKEGVAAQDGPGKAREKDAVAVGVQDRDIDAGAVGDAQFFGIKSIVGIGAAPGDAVDVAVAAGYRPTGFVGELVGEYFKDQGYEGRIFTGRLRRKRQIAHGEQDREGYNLFHYCVFM